MDNEPFIMQKVKNNLRSMVYKLQYIDKNVASVEEGSDIISFLLQHDTPFMVCRVGATEGRIIQKWMNNSSYTDKDIENIKMLSGVFPNKEEYIDRFCEVYTNSVQSADVILTWGCVGEKKIINRFASKQVKLLKNDTYNILFYDNPWTCSLKGKKVLIVHPFVDTIASQYLKRDKLFDTEKLPEFGDISFVRAVQSSAGENEFCNYKSWFDALDAMKNAIASKEFDVALIGAGAYGIPLAAYVKSIGKQAIHMAGNLQIIFGIRGKRWDNFPQYVQYFNENWVYPSMSETPKRKETVEGGSYWK